ncbi:MAG: signal peptidase II [Defluviitaleaceae bacterium]|nr:signal peptidase II [Defluviitaleaceae bacterium]
MIKKWVLPIAFVGIIFAIDQITKWLTIQHLFGQPERVVIDGVLSLVYHENSGMAWGMLQGGRWFFIIITPILLTAMIWYYTTLPKTRIANILRVFLLILFGGALGNFYDRLFRESLINDTVGVVVDMFAVRFINFPVFNMADVFIVVSVIALAVLTFFVKDDRPSKKLRFSKNG